MVILLCDIGLTVGKLASVTAASDKVQSYTETFLYTHFSEQMYADAITKNGLSWLSSCCLADSNSENVVLHCICDKLVGNRTPNLEYSTKINPSKEDRDTQSYTFVESVQ